MKIPRKTLADKLRSFKRELYVPIAAAGVYLSSGSSPLYAQAATRITETEEFISEATISKSNIRYPDDYLAEDGLKHWNVNTGQLVINDYNEKWGSLRYHWNNSTFNFTKKNGCIITKFNKDEWGAADFYGLVFAGDPIGNTYYEFVINASPNAVAGQFSINQRNPHTNVTFINAEDEAIIQGGINTLEVRYNSGTDYTDNQNRSITEGWNFFINNKKVATLVPLNSYLGQLDGYVGVEGWDSSGGNDTYPIKSNVYFQNFIEEFDDPNAGIGGGQNAKRVRKDLLGREAGLENKLIPDNPKVFKRGDSNMDQTVNISDAVYTLNTIFRDGQPLQCPDSADANDDGAVDISDAVKTLLHLFAGQGLPYPNRVAFGGIDLTPDQLEYCQGYPYEWPNATGR